MAKNKRKKKVSTVSKGKYYVYELIDPSSLVCKKRERLISKSKSSTANLSKALTALTALTAIPFFVSSSLDIPDDTIIRYCKGEKKTFLGVIE
jgi:hypothetical protein